MRLKRILATFVVLAIVLGGYLATKWIIELTTPLSPAAARLVQIFSENAPRVAEQRIPVLVIESLVCGNFSPQQLDEAVSSPIPFFLKQEKRMEDGNQVWRFERQDLSGYYTMRIVMDPGGGDEVCQASMRKV